MNSHDAYFALVDARYGEAAKASYESEGDFLFVKFAPYQYLVEDQMLEYLTRFPTASLRDAATYLDIICPDGLPPGDDGEDL